MLLGNSSLMMKLVFSVIGVIDFWVKTLSSVDQIRNSWTHRSVKILMNVAHLNVTWPQLSAPTCRALSIASAGLDLHLLWNVDPSLILVSALEESQTNPLLSRPTRMNIPRRYG